MKKPKKISQNANTPILTLNIEVSRSF